MTQAAKVIIYTKETCPYCMKAKELFDNKGVVYTQIPIDDNPGLREEMINKSGRHTVPQIFIDDQAIGGYDDLSELNRVSKLDSLLG